MPRNDYIPKPELATITWAKSFAKAAEENLSEVGLTQAEIDALKVRIEEFADARKDAVSLHVRAQAATTKKDKSLEALLSDARRLAQAARNSPAADNGLLIKLGLTTKMPKRRRVHPERPTDLTAEGLATGQVKLKWSRNGNPKGTIFIVEARLYDGSGWQFVASVLKPSYVDLYRRPGVKIDYRVTARRTDFKSPPSSVAVAWGNDPWEQPKLFAA